MHYFLVGPPSAPGLTATLSADLVSFEVTISPPTPLECVTNYTLTVNSSDNSDIMDITVPTAQTSVPVDDVSICSESYSITVVPNTIEGPGPWSVPFTSGMQPDFLGLWFRKIEG